MHTNKIQQQNKMNIYETHNIIANQSKNCTSLHLKNGHGADKTSQIIKFQRNMVFTKKNIYNYWLKWILDKLSNDENELSAHLIENNQKT